MTQSENFDWAAQNGESESCLNFAASSESWLPNAMLSLHSATVWTSFYGWCLNSYAMLKHCIIAAFESGFDEIWSWDELRRSQNNLKKVIFCKIDCFPSITQKYRKPSIRPQHFWAPVPRAGTGPGNFPKIFNIAARLPVP